MFLKPEKLQNHSNKAKGKEKKKERGEGKKKKKKKAMVALLVFILATLEIVFDRKKNCWTQKVHLAITFSKIPARYSSLQKYTKFTFRTLDNCEIKYF